MEEKEVIYNFIFYISFIASIITIINFIKEDIGYYYKKYILFLFDDYEKIREYNECISKYKKLGISIKDAKEYCYHDFIIDANKRYIKSFFIQLLAFNISTYIFLIISLFILNKYISEKPILEITSMAFLSSTIMYYTVFGIEKLKFKHLIYIFSYVLIISYIYSFFLIYKFDINIYYINFFKLLILSLIFSILNVPTIIIVAKHFAFDND